MKILILGAGAWGTALAVSAAGTLDGGVPRHQVSLWARDAARAQAMKAERANTRYLPGIVLPDSTPPCLSPGSAKVLRRRLPQPCLQVLLLSLLALWSMKCGHRLLLI